MSSLFERPSPASGLPQDWAKIANRRSAPAMVRLRAGLFLRYSATTGARESDTFIRDARTWATFEHAVTPELENFNFFDQTRQIFVAPSAVLADAMFHLWTVTDLGLDESGRPTTLTVITELAHYLCSVYETAPIDQRTPKASWLGLNRKN